MNNYSFAGRRRREHGIANIEFAFILPLLIFLLAFSLFIGRIFWHYGVIQKAAYDGARYLSSVEQTEIVSPDRVAYSVAVARAIVDAETAELNPMGIHPPADIQCDGKTCNGVTVPGTVTVFIQMRLLDPVLAGYTAELAGDYGYLITADVTLPYVAN